MKRRRASIISDDDDEPVRSSQGPSQRRRTGSSQASQRSTQASQRDDDDFTQPAERNVGIASITDKERDVLVNSIVRYCLFCHAEKKPIRRADISTVCLDKYKKLRILSDLVDLAQERLRYIMGMELVQMPKTAVDKDGHTRKNVSTGIYILKSIFERERIDELIGDYHTPTERTERNLLMIILSIIELSNGSIEQGELMRKLKKLDLHTLAYTDPENVSEQWWDKVTKNTFVSQLYLLKVKTKVVGSDPTFTFKIGPRGKAEIGRMKIMEHIAKTFGDNQIDPIKKREIEEEMRQEEINENEPIHDEDEIGASQASQGTQRKASTRGRPRKA